MNRNDKKPWSLGEIFLLMDLWQRGFSVKGIGRMLGRHPDGVQRGLLTLRDYGWRLRKGHVSQRKLSGYK